MSDWHMDFVPDRPTNVAEGDIVLSSAAAGMVICSALELLATALEYPPEFMPDALWDAVCNLRAIVDEHVETEGE